MKKEFKLPWRDPSNNNFLSWVYILLFGAWGGIVRYIIDVRAGQISRGLIAVLAQVIISGFTGILAGLLSEGVGAAFHTTLAVCGISGAMGVTALDYYWRRLTERKNGRS
ncbi:holin [Rahnella aquatilis]|uniref:Phage holin family protein n=2 Tax=Rahnella perminowiae TaxID=2816244 RepID=A0ABS6KXM0_9GAMM|nr:phage holin family protein [Rahnella perminowiae]UJD88058.1 holin [Rahnella aquatilis]